MDEGHKEGKLQDRLREASCGKVRPARACVPECGCMAIFDAIEELDRLERSLSDAVRERDEARGAAVKANRDVERLHGILREMKAAMLGYPMSTRVMTPTALLASINRELREEAPK